MIDLSLHKIGIGQSGGCALLKPKKMKKKSVWFLIKGYALKIQTLNQTLPGKYMAQLRRFQIPIERSRGMMLIRTHPILGGYSH